MTQTSPADALLSGLNARFARPGAIAFDVSDLGGIVAQLQQGSSQATVALKGAQVLSYCPDGDNDVMWVSPVARLDGDRAVRGGIPVCWPWFGKHPTATDQPSHGYARTAYWTVTQTAATTDGPEIRFELPRDANAQAPDLAASVTVHLSQQSLRVRLETTNAGSTPVEITQALHSYFQISDIEDISVDGFDGTHFLDTLTGQTHQQVGHITFSAETDRIHANPDQSPSVLVDGSRTVTARHGQESYSCVVWTPWVEKARRLGDVPDESWRRFVCIETANAGADVLSLPAGATRGITVEITSGERSET